jgi:hypothetical protein
MRRHPQTRPQGLRALPGVLADEQDAADACALHGLFEDVGRGLRAVEHQLGLDHVPEAGVLECPVELLGGKGTGIGDDAQAGAALPELSKHPGHVGAHGELLDPVPLGASLAEASVPPMSKKTAVPVSGFMIAPDH